MAGLPRKTQLVWGGNLTPNGNIGKPGSLASGLEVYSNDPAVLQAGAWINGWMAAIIGTDSPVLEELNGILFTITQQLAYVLERGIAEYDSGTTYNIGDLARAAGGSTIYSSKVDGNLNQPFSNTNDWKVFGSDLFDALGAAVTAQSNAEAYAASVASAAEAAAIASANATTAAAIAALQPGLAKAWCSFTYIDGTLTVLKSYNIASFAWISDSSFHAVFSNPMADGAYGLSGFAVDSNNTSTNGSFICTDPTAMNPTDCIVVVTSNADTHVVNVQRGFFAIYD